MWGIDATMATTALEAEKLWNEALAAGQGFDAVILDLKGLAESGVDLARKIRSDMRGKRAEVIFLIGMDRFVADKSLDEIDAVATLSKPVRPSEMFNALMAVAVGARNQGVSSFFVQRNTRSAMPYFNARILCAEDNPVNQDVVIGILENMGIKVVTAPNGAVAARLMAQEKFDAVLMDCEMPEMDGFEATRRIRQLEAMTGELADGKAQHTPIIALTAHALADIRDRCIDAGMDDFLVKPFDEAQMGQTLRRWIGPLEREATDTERRRAARRFVRSGEAPPEEAAIDMSVLDSVSAFKGANGGVLLNRVIARFNDTAPNLVAQLHEKFDAGAGEELWRIAHTLKSSSAALGAKRLSKRCAEIEALAKANGVSAVAPLLETLNGELAAALKGLHAITGESNESAAAVG
jgi:CheY-like chemotaxis protein